MADHIGSRCTRRKQANPRRKNVEIENMPEEVDLDHLSKQSASETTSNGDDELSTAGTNGTEFHLHNNPQSSLVQKEEEEEVAAVVTAAAAAVDLLHSSSSSLDDDGEDKHLQAAEGAGEEKVKCEDSVTAVPNGFHHRRRRERSKGKVIPATVESIDEEDDEGEEEDEEEEEEEDEEEKIREYLGRSDTAVIFPEPVDTDTDAASKMNGASSHIGCNRQLSALLLKCPHCSAALSTVQDFRDHLTIEHGAGLAAEAALGLNNSTAANACDKENTDSRAAAAVTTECPFACNQCSATFQLRDQLEKHELLHSPTTQACKICNKTFANVYRLQRHMISHDESAVLRKFKCPECEKAFKFKHHLKEHIRIHSGEKPFACPNCGKRFSHSGSYSSHMTSKKCLVMNLKVRRIDKPPTPRGSSNATGGAAVGPSPNSSSNSMGNSRRNGQSSFQLILPKNGVGNEAEVLDMGLGPRFQAPSAAFPVGYPQFVPPSYTSLALHPLLAGNRFPSPPPPPLPPPSLPPPSPSRFPVPSSVLQMPTKEEDIDEDSGEEGCTIFPKKGSDADAGKAAANGDLHAVKKILEAVNATVSRQQKECTNKMKNGSGGGGELGPILADVKSEPRNGTDHESGECHERFQTFLEVALHRQKGKCGEVDEDDEEEDGDEEGGKVKVADSSDSRCNFCHVVFQSKIDLHQHERYLCPCNQELLRVKSNSKDDVKVEVKREKAEDRLSDDDVNAKKKDSGAHTVSSSLDPADGDDTLKGRLGKFAKVHHYHQSSMTVSESQVQLLRAFFSRNPRPRKPELGKIADEIGLSLPMVQAWFQCARFHDRKGIIHRPYDNGLSSQQYNSSKSSPAYPMVSSFNGTIPMRISPAYYPSPTLPPPTPIQSQNNLIQIPAFLAPTSSDRVNGQHLLPSSSPPCTSSSSSSSSSLNPHFQPLNLSRESAAEGSARDAEQPLDLSVKSCRPSPARSSSPTNSDGEALNLSRKSSPYKESNNAEISSSNHHHHHQHHHHLRQHLVGTGSASSFAAVEAIRTTPTMVSALTGTPPPPLRGPGSVTSSSPSPSSSTIFSPHTLAHHHHHHHHHQLHNHHMHHHSHIGASHVLLAAHERPASDTASSSGVVYRGEMDDENDAARVSPYGWEAEDGDDTLEVDESADDKKKLWKQSEADESQAEMNDSSLGEDDRPLKRRRSWKQHKVDAEEGMYACDQCDKMFSKQSSLARHKYEHSGQRPHKCDVCNKAFKHKHHLTEHKRLHSGEKPFQCKKCLKRFSHSGSYSQHMNHRYSYCKPYRE